MDKTEESFSLRLVLDTRRMKDNGRYPLKLRVYSLQEQKAKLIKMDRDLYPDEFKEVTEKRSRKTYKELKKEIDSELRKAEEVAASLEQFSLMAFDKKFRERQMMSIAPLNGDLLTGYQRAIDTYRGQGQIKTAETYRCSMSSVLSYLEKTKDRKPKKVLYAEITKPWLEKYERFMLDQEQKSVNTLGQYLRSMRAVFNDAIDAGEIGSDIYPFKGKNSYVIPRSQNVKMPLTEKQLQGLLKAKPQSEEQEVAKDFWILSYGLFGLNMADILNLRYKQIEGNILNLRFREKTKRISKASLSSWRLWLRKEQGLDIIDKYGNPDRSPERMIFSTHRGSHIAQRFFLRPDMSEKEKVDRRDEFNSFIREHIKEMAAANGISTKNIKNISARHTSATRAARAGFSKTQIERNMGHTSKDVTEGYIDYNSDEELEAMSDCLFNF